MAEKVSVETVFFLAQDMRRKKKAYLQKQAETRPGQPRGEKAVEDRRVLFEEAIDDFRKLCVSLVEGNSVIE